jgi:serine/threonine-protein kinase
VNELRLLGSLDLRGPGGDRLESVLAQPKGLGLLAYLVLAAPRKPQRRDVLIALFWPEQDEAHARNSLNQCLHRLRRALGSETIVSRGNNDVGVDPTRVSCDVLSFEAALAAGDHATAVAAYGGHLLSGFFVRGCPEFERWVEAERSRLHRAYAGALERIAFEADAAGDAEEAVRCWRQVAEVDPYATRVTVRLIAALELAGDRAGALQVAEQHGLRLKADLDAEPSPEVEALAHRLKVQPVPRAPAQHSSTRERLASAVAGRYRVTGVAGAGAMALVYRADDLKLGRPVALKVLRPELAAMIGHERFLNEVDIAAGLAHPNILPLHDVGAANGLLYYVMPFVEGESLRARLAREGPLEVEHAVRIAREVAEALEHAHGKGIVHRDVKPANILLLADHAVVSDFGVARAVGEIVDDPALVAATGTPAYMSPEQAAGSPDVDARSDLYSLGCVLYEMLTGEPPDRESGPPANVGETLPEAALSLSLRQQPVPASVASALTKALATNPADRFRTAEEFVTALESGGPSRYTLRPRNVKLPGVAVVGAVLLVVGAVAVWTMTRPFTLTASNNRQVTFDPGREVRPAISPDGSEIVYVAGFRVNETRLFLRGVGGGSPRLIAERGHRPQWSADGERVYFGGWTGRGSMFAIKEVGKLGGAVRILNRPNGFSNATVSPDGTRHVYWRNPSPDVAEIVVGDLEGGEESEEVFAVVRGREGPLYNFAWSPDGLRLAYQEGRGSLLDARWTSAVWVVGAGGEPIRITDEEHRNVSPVWFPDNRHVMFVSDRDGPRDIYVVDADDPGEPQRVSFGGLDPESMSLSADGTRLAYSKYRVRSDVWAIPIPRSGTVSIAEGRRVTTVNWNQQIMDHDLSPDGDTIAFDRVDRRGESQIYKMALEDGVEIQLTADSAGAYSPIWSPDGREILFVKSGASGGEDVWVMDADGGNKRREMEIPDHSALCDWSDDGLKVICGRGRAGVWAVSRDSTRQGFDMPVGFGEPFHWYDGACSHLRRIKSGGGVVCSHLWDGAFKSLLWLSPEGKVERRFDPTPNEEARRRWMAVVRGDDNDHDLLWWIRHPRYSPDGSTLYFFGNPGGAVFVMTMPAEGGELRRLVVFDDPSVTPLKPSNNGEGFAALTVSQDTLYLSVGEAESDIWVMDLEW